MPACPTCGWKLPLFTTRRGKNRKFSCPDCETKLHYVCTTEKIGLGFVPFMMAFPIYSNRMDDVPGLKWIVLAVIVISYTTLIALGEKLVIREEEESEAKSGSLPG